MKDGKSVVRAKPKIKPIKTEYFDGDPRDDLRGRLVKHRARLRAFDAPDAAKPPRQGKQKH